ncbi:MAG: hypothetical protein ACOC0N_04435 [Chroococcales cyanobacterium]
MDEQRQQAYLNLIQALLDIPKEQQLTLIQANQDIVDIEFLELTANLAKRLEEQGEVENANRLREVLQKLAIAFSQAAEMSQQATPEPTPSTAPFDRTEAYIQLIDAMLSCPTGEDAAQLLNANRELIDVGLVQTLTQMSISLNQKGDQNGADLLRQIATHLAEAIGLK